jgi:hypothetical protein
MAKGGFFKNYRVYILTAVAYMGALLFGESNRPSSSLLSDECTAFTVLLSALFGPVEHLLHLSPPSLKNVHILAKALLTRGVQRI